MSQRILLKLALAAAGGAVVAMTGRAMLRRSRYFDLTNKGVIVTGGSRGLGLQLARELGERGAKLAICARDIDELRRAQEDLAQRGAQVFVDTADVTDADQVRRFVERARAYFRGGGGQGIDALVNNAGVITVGPISHMNLEDFQRTMETNFNGALHFILNVLPEMRQRGSGRIVNIASFGGKVPSPHLAAYAASKFALVGLSSTLRTELADDGVYVSTICPGLMRTGSPPQANFKGRYEEEFTNFTTLDHLPIFSVSPTRIARKIVDALQYGDAELSSPFYARWLGALHGMAPNLSAEIVSLINGLMPSRAPVGGDITKTGRESDSDSLGRFTRARLRESERKYNQLSGNDQKTNRAAS